MTLPSEPLRLLTVHAHPDDESSKGAGTVARYKAEGVQTVLVCCTGGEEGEILNSAMDRDDVRADLPAVRKQELLAAAEIIGYDHVEWLGYRDSGMAGSASNSHPDSFARADATAAVGLLVTLIRRYRPHVVVTYGDEQELYPHPDHLRVHDIGVAAVASAGDVAAYPSAGSPWAVPKLYFSVWALAKIRRLRDVLEAQGVETPFPPNLDEMPDTDHRISTRIDVRDRAHVRKDALRAHATQIDPDSPLWFGVPPEVEDELYSADDYVLAYSSVKTTTPEDDLFAGLRHGA